MLHKFTHRMYQIGEVLKVKQVGTEVSSNAGGLRGDVVGFSKQARKRLIEKILATDLTAMGRAIFVTLTYHLPPTSSKKARANLFAWWERVKRRWGGGVSCLWRMELQKRGVEHFHLVIFGVDFMPKDWLSKSWWEVCGKVTEEHLKAGTRVENIRSKRGVVWYVAKYISKAEEGVTTGRVWGLLGRKNWKMQKVVTYNITHEQRLLLAEVYRQKVTPNFDDTRGFSLFGNIAQEALQAIFPESPVSGRTLPI